MALTQISTQGIKDGTITGSDLATNVDLVDNQKLRLGTGNDLQIYFDGTNSFIKEPNSVAGQLVIDGYNGTDIRRGATGDHMIRAIGGGAVELYHNGSKKFETTANGIFVTNIPNNQGIELLGAGNNTCIRFRSTGSSPAHSYRVNFHSTTGGLFNSPCLSFDKTATNGDFSGHIAAISDDGFHLDDNKKLHLGGKVTSGDFQIYHDGSHSYLNNLTGSLQVQDAGSEKFRVSGTGTFFKDDITLSNDNDKINIGAGDDLQIYHNGTHSYIDETQNGNLVLRTNPSGTYAALVLQAGQENSVICHKNGNVELYYDNSKKFETKSTGGQITGQLQFADGGSSTGSNMVSFGSSDDLKIYHDGSTSHVQDNVSNVLRISSDSIALQSGDKSEAGLVYSKNGSVDLYYNNSKRFETLVGGVQWTGSIKNPTDGTDQGIYFGVDSDFQISHDGSSNHIKGTGNHFTRFWTGNTNRWNITNDGHFRPEANNAYDIGASNQRVRNIYTNDLNLSNEGGANDVDGTWGSYTIQEGAEDLFLVNKRSGKKYKFNLTEVK
jgi:hypothetical protein